MGLYHKDKLKLREYQFIKESFQLKKVMLYLGQQLLDIDTSQYNHNQSLLEQEMHHLAVISIFA